MEGQVRKEHLAVLGLVVGFSMGITTRGIGQDCGTIIGDCNGTNNEWEHTVPELVPKDVENLHARCMWCMAGGVPVDPEDCHPMCDGEGLTVLDALLNAAQEGDLASVLALAREAPEYVAFNAKRQSIQVVSCDRRLWANLPIRDRRTLLLATRHLRTVDMMMLAGDSD
jgi:hypothetical protein